MRSVLGMAHSVETYVSREVAVAAAPFQAIRLQFLLISWLKWPILMNTFQGCLTCLWQEYMLILLRTASHQILSDTISILGSSWVLLALTSSLAQHCKQQVPGERKSELQPRQPENCWPALASCFRVIGKMTAANPEQSSIDIEQPYQRPLEADDRRRARPTFAEGVSILGSDCQAHQRLVCTAKKAQRSLIYAQ